MKVKELIEKLQEIDPELDLLGVYDGGFGSGPVYVELGSEYPDGTGKTVCLVEVGS